MKTGQFGHLASSFRASLSGLAEAKEMPTMQKRVLSKPTVTVITLTLFLVLFSNAKVEPHFRSAQWPIAGQDLSNSWNQPAEHRINPANVHNLAPKWAFTTGGDVSATPTVDGEAVYVPDWAGNLFAIGKESGQVIWSHKISEYDGVTGSI